MREQKLKKALESRQEGIIILEDIHDPHNAAAVFRSCEAFGIQKVALIFEQEKRFNPRRVGKISSSSANKWLDFEIFTSTSECLQALRRRGYHIVATALDETATPLSTASLIKPKTALMFGNEHRGLSQTALKLAHEIVYLPMRGLVQSLNLSVTAAICIYEMDRQRSLKIRKKPYILGKKEQLRLWHDWLRRGG